MQGPWGFGNQFSALAFTLERKKKVSENILWSKSKYYFMKLLFQVFKKNV